MPQHGDHWGFSGELECVPEEFWGTLSLRCAPAQAGWAQGSSAHPLPVPQVMPGPALVLPGGPCWVLGLSGNPDVEKGVWPGQS